MLRKQEAIAPVPAAASPSTDVENAQHPDEGQLSNLKVKKWLIESALECRNNQEQHDQRQIAGYPKPGGDSNQSTGRAVIRRSTDTHDLTFAEMTAEVPARQLSDVEALDEQIDEELTSKWILNLSMRLRDKSDREKFFLTYAEQPNKWRRLTVTIDYKHAQSGTLEGDLRELYYQRDKSHRIYESMRETLLQIRFFETVTNLKLRTIDGQLHVHCSEDKNEIIKYPRALALSYVPFPVYREQEVVFESHISGFVYKVMVDGHVFVKKDIAGPGSVDEFMYEVTALSTLHRANHVITLHGLVVDNSGACVKGLLLEYASKGSLMDIIYDCRFEIALPWSRRERWARQIVDGLSQVHEAGFVQGDLTLSNIVIDSEDNVRLIDINRRGCPIGWEPPELETLLRAGQNISMFISIKTDLYQLGMALWGLVMCIDEPQLEPRPLSASAKFNVPAYLKDVMQICSQTDPRKRLSAKELLARFPDQKHDSEEGVQVDRSDNKWLAGHSDSDNRRLAMLSRGKAERDASSHVSGPSSTRTRGVDTVGSSDCLSDGRSQYALRGRSTRDCSPATLSENSG